MARELLAGVLGIAILIGAWAFAGSSLFDTRSSDIKLAELGEIDFEIPKDRVIVDYGVSADGIVSYNYLTQPVPLKLAEREIVEMRNETSYTTLINVEVPGDDPLLKLNTVIYSQPAFAKDIDGSWKYLEYATTTEQAFRNRDKTLWTGIREVFARSAYADSISPFSGAGDGDAGFYSTSVSPVDFDPCPQDDWGIAHDAVTGTGANAGFDNTSISSYGSEVFDFGTNRTTCEASISRAFFPFDTSAIPSAATISVATLNLYIWVKTNGSNDGFDYITVVRSTQATHTTLATADYDQCGAITSPTEGIDTGERKDITSISTGTYLVITLNSTGRSWIAKSGVSSVCSATAGITCLGVREGHDTTNNSLVYSGNRQESINPYTSERTGTSEDPYLSVTYSTAASTIPGPSFNIGGNGLFEVGSNGLLEIAPF